MRVGIAVAIGLSTVAQSVDAQVTDEQLANRQSASVVEEVIVTAQRREQNLQKIPLAVSALTADALADRQVNSVSEVDRYVPNLQWGPASSGSGNTSSLSIRGIGQIDFATTTDPGVAVHLDGVYLGWITGSTLEAGDIERIEVLRGPQGTLFGRNSAGGAVNIITAKPTGELGGKVELSGGVYTEDNAGKYRGKFSLDVPLTDDLAAKLSVARKYSEGWGRNVAPGRGEGLGEDDDTAVRLALLFNPSGNFDLYFTADHSDRDGTVMPHAALLGPEALGRDDPREVRLSVDTQDKMEVTGLALTANLHLSDVTFRSITGYRKQHGGSGQDFDGSDLPITDQFMALHQKQFTQEFHFFGSAFDQRLDWLLGLFYFKEDAGFRQDFEFFEVPLVNVTENSTESRAAFVNATFHVTDALRLTGGLRYTDETKEVDLIETPSMPPNSASANFSDVSPKIALEYQVTPDVMGYVSWSRGFRSGGFNGRPVSSADLEPYDEEINDSYEAGLKSDWLDGALRLNLAAFLSQYKGIQLTTVIAATDVGVVAVMDNAGDADIKGLEAEFEYAASQRLKIYASLGLQDVQDVIEARPGFVLDPSRVGDSLPQASEVNSVLGFSYQLPWRRYESSVGADWVYRSAYFHQIDNNELTEEDGYHLLNARFNLKLPDNWSVTVYGKNLTNEVYRTFGAAFAPLNLATVWYGPTREIGAIASWSF